MRATLAALLMGTGFAAAAAAQTPSGSIVGRIVDLSDAVVSGATIRVRNVNTNEVRTVESQAEGSYTVSNLPPGTYEVIIEKLGFKPLRERGLELQVEQTARVDARLEIGDVAESVEITAHVPLINTETSSRGDVVTPREIREMPLNGRDFNDLAFTVPGVQPAEQNAKGSPYTINGARADASNILIDGLNDENPRDAGAQARPPLDALQEFKLQTSGYSAEYGRLAGGVVSMVLKSGGNQLRGSLSEFVRNDAFDARNFFDVAKSELRRNQFGGTVGGPLLVPKAYDGHDRTFYLVSWESFRGVQGTNSLGVVPTALERAGDFSQSFDATGRLILIKDPLASGPCTTTNSSGCFQGNRIPTSRMSPITQQLLQYPGLPPGKHSLLERMTADFGLSCEQELKIEPLLHDEESVTKPLLRFTSFSSDQKQAVMVTIKLAARRQIRSLLTPEQQKLMDVDMQNVAKTAKKGSQPAAKSGDNSAAKADALDEEEALSRAVTNYAALTAAEKKAMLLDVKRAGRADANQRLTLDQQKKLDSEIAELSR